MDQQYDAAKIDGPGELCAYTVQEAVSKGFRRADPAGYIQKWWI